MNSSTIEGRRRVASAASGLRQTPGMHHQDLNEEDDQIKETKCNEEGGGATAAVADGSVGGPGYNKLRASESSQGQFSFQGDQHLAQDNLHSRIDHEAAAISIQKSPSG